MVANRSADETEIQTGQSAVSLRPTVVAARRSNAAARLDVRRVRAAAPTLTGFSSGWPPEVVMGIATPPSSHGLEGLGYANRQFPNRDRRLNSVTTLKFASTHGPRFIAEI
jgi:hypothetical protein